ncbi:Wzz/FepE/Etk N-terminal domain-containing protein [Bowmanella dokdonensis]|uniref:LPS O-antigen length regulator n=1 Tax=Bowmanella dokdonensis TaxID=751969 RepID=A0A939DRU5_9ALTE|nr:Wzz/FepE/Etk N-terminal domain-containing protein [Bowmanella dokdonensis]MBN7827513.1 LPS O-antigen length regulator [Bowmanella dokdonensis]
MTNRTQESETSITALLHYLWTKKLYVILLPLAFGICTAFWSLTLPNLYKSTALLTPADGMSESGLQGLTGQLGGVASLAGLSFGAAGGQSKIDVALAILESRQFLFDFIDRHELAVPLLASKEWEPEAKTLEIDPDVYDIESQKWVRKVGFPRRQVPSKMELYETFLGVLDVEQDTTTGIVTLSVVFKDPHLAQHWASKLVDDLNDKMRRREVDKTRKNIAYLKAQVEKTENVEVKQVFYDLIQEQYKNLMLAEVREDFVFDVIDKAIVPEMKDSPKRALMVVVATFIMGFLVVVVFLIMFLLKDESKYEQS